ncbi:MAG: hypothetical protein M3N16_06365 [Actinomycetota bacterium]|nr:hypothetical protein [Actinomycetota bacterium]
MPPPETAIERAGELGERILPDRTPKLRVLVIVNPYATTVSDRLKNLVVYALQARYEVEAVDTVARDHATALCREAAAAGYDLVIAFGGDGTVNEAANGLVGSATPLTVLPGGSTNVFCRLLGIPDDVVDATEHLLALADAFQSRRVDAGRVDGRHFVFASGVGLDARVVERREDRARARPRGEWRDAGAALSSFGRYLVRPPRLRLEAGGRSVEAVTVIVQNAESLTFLGKRAIRVCEGAALDAGTLSIAALRRATPLALPTLAPRFLSGRAATVARHRQVEGFPGVREARVVALGDEPFPVEVDGSYLGRYDEVAYEVVPRGLAVVA